MASIQESLIHPIQVYTYAQVAWNIVSSLHKISMSLGNCSAVILLKVYKTLKMDKEIVDIYDILSFVEDVDVLKDKLKCFVGMDE